MKIENKKTVVPKCSVQNEEDILNDILMTFKHLVTNYATALNEASNSVIYDKYFSQFEKISMLQAEIFEVLFQNGWYTLEKAEDKKITQKYDEYNQKKEQLKSS